MKKLAVVTVIAMVSVLAMGALSANSAVKKFNTNVTINYKPGTYGDKFNGKVKSPKPACRKKRTVVVKRVRPGSDQKIGSDKSNKKGKWEVDVGGFAQSGKYYALAKKKKLNSGICKKKKSRTVTVP